MDGKELIQYIGSLYGDTKITPERIEHAMSMIDPVNYLLKNHKVKGHPVTFNIPDYDYSRAVGHRPWQMEIIRSLVNPELKEINVEKSRQLGLTY